MELVMKKLLAIMAMIPALAGATEMWTNAQTGAVAPWPPVRPANVIGVTAEWYAERGWQQFDVAQQAAHDAAEASALAEQQAEAEAWERLPMMSPNGFAATNEAGHWVKFIPASTNEISETLAVQISHSPPDPVVAAQMERDAKAKWKAGKDAEAASAAKKLAAIEDAGKNGKVNDRLYAIEAALKELLK